MTTKRDWKTTLREEFWRPGEDDRVWMRRRIGWGWNINFATLSRRRRERRARRARA
jgi:hypothetical protein